MRKYINSNINDCDDSVEIFADSEGIYDISEDSDDTYYTFDTFEDYQYFVNHVRL